MKRTLLTLAAALFLLPASAQQVPEWLKEGILYHIYPSSFKDSDGDGIGDLEGIRSKLPYVKSLGANTIWLSPVFRSEFEDGGYDITDYYKEDPRFGTNTQLVELIRDAHAKGIRICLDLVAGHTSDKHPWFRQSRSADTNLQYSDYYIWSDSKSSLPTKKFVKSDAPRNGNFLKNYFEVQPALNYGYAHPDPDEPWQQGYDDPGPRAVRQEIRNIMAFWMDKGVDGFRCDMACEVPIDFWQQTLPALRKEYPGIYLLAEGEAPALHDGAFDASYAWELHHLLNDIAQGRKSAADLRAYVARDAAAMPREAFRLMFTSNHDENSWAGTEFERMGDAARVMAFLTFTLPNGQPLVYTGQEMGFDHRFEFFEKDPVPAWEHNGFTDFYTALIRLRHENPALAAGERGGQAAYPLGERTPDGLMLFSRTAGGNEVTVAANLSAEEVAFDLPFEGSRREFFTGKEYTGGTRTVLPAWQWLVFAQDRR